jgi:hypothetical protein
LVFETFESVGKINFCMELCGGLYLLHLWNLCNAEKFLFYWIFCIILLFISESGFKLWERGKQKQSLLQRNEWINSTRSSAALSVTMALVLNVACKYRRVCVFFLLNVYHAALAHIFVRKYSISVMVMDYGYNLVWSSCLIGVFLTVTWRTW